jgi:pyrimidine operon attenuation protein / uracil phosphoribosyltransferase
MKILNHKQIEQKIRRLTVEILERNSGETHLILAGINNNGLEMARLLMDELTTRTDAQVVLTRLRVNPAAPTEHPIFLEMPIQEVADKTVIVVDDVANTGRTLFYALKPLFEVLPKKVEIAVLVDRKHKTFPIQPDYVGLTLATTLRENIQVHLRDVQERSVELL